MKQLILAISLAFILSSCSQKSDTENSPYKYHLKIDLENRTILDTAHLIVDDIIQLDQTEEGDILSGGLGNFECKGDYILFMDQPDNTSLPGSIWIFNKQGALVSQILATGSGPGEYSYLSNFYFDDKKSIGYIYDMTLGKILAYNTNGEFIFDIPFREYVTDFVIKDSLVYSFYVNQPEFDSSYNLLNIYDFDGRKVTKAFAMDKETVTCSTFLGNKVMFDKEGKLIYKVSLNNTIYTLDEDFNELKDYVKISFIDKNINTNKLQYRGKPDMMQVIKMMNEANTGNTHRMIDHAGISDHGILYSSWRERELWFFYYNFEKRTTTSYIRSASFKKVYNWHMTKDNSIYAMIDSWELNDFIIENKDYLSGDLLQKAHKINNKLEEEDNPVILKMKILN